MVNTRTDADLSAAVQNALQTLLSQIRVEIREEFRTTAGTEEEQAKNFQWGLRKSTLNHLMCMPFTNVAQVANAARNYEILYERDDDDVERPGKRNHGHNNDRHGSDRRGGGDNHRSSNNNYFGNNNRNSGNGRDQRNRGQQSNRYANSAIFMDLMNRVFHEFLDNVAFLGHIVSAEGITMDPAKYHPGKANVVADALSMKSGMIAGIKVEEEIICDLGRLDIKLY
nr:zinc finger, CCHC-type, retrotransposon Gag domain protein [Tanacetum cinerariifolium]